MLNCNYFDNPKINIGDIVEVYYNYCDYTAKTKFRIANNISNDCGEILIEVDPVKNAADFDVIPGWYYKDNGMCKSDEKFYSPLDENKRYWWIKRWHLVRKYNNSIMDNE